MRRKSTYFRTYLNVTGNFFVKNCTNTHTLTVYSISTTVHSVSVLHKIFFILFLAVRAYQDDQFKSTSLLWSLVSCKFVSRQVSPDHQGHVTPSLTNLQLSSSSLQQPSGCDLTAGSGEEFNDIHSSIFNHRIQRTCCREYIYGQIL